MITRIVGKTWLTSTQPSVTGRRKVRNRASPYAAGSASRTVRAVVATATTRLLVPASTRLARRMASPKLTSVGLDGHSDEVPSAISRVLLNAVDSSQSRGNPRNTTYAGQGGVLARTTEGRDPSGAHWFGSLRRDRR